MRLRSIVPVVCCAAATVAAAPARADWAYTAWGDTPDAVIAKSGAMVRAASGTRDQRVFGQDWRAAGSSVFEGMTIDTQFFFDRGNHGLSVVKLKPGDPAACDQLGRAAAARYGSADRDSTDQPLAGLAMLHRSWHRAADNLSILFVDTRAATGDWRSCHLLYRPFAATRGD